jgi:hypothetical protein
MGNVLIFSMWQAKNTKCASNKTVLFFCWHKSLYRYRVNLLYRTACSFLLFNLTQFICCVLERSIQNVLTFSQSQFCPYQEQLHVSVSTDRQHNVPNQYQNATHINWTYIAFSVLDHSSVQSVVIQQLAATELFCKPNVICTGTVTVLGSVIKLLGDICVTAVQLSVHTAHRYGTAVYGTAKTWRLLVW